VFSCVRVGPNNTHLPLTFEMELVSDAGCYNSAVLHNAQSLGGSTRLGCETHGERNLPPEQLLHSHMPKRV
jgi:hypothetical protein